MLKKMMTSLLCTGIIVMLGFVGFTLLKDIITEKVNVQIAEELKAQIIEEFEAEGWDVAVVKRGDGSEYLNMYDYETKIFLNMDLDTRTFHSSDDEYNEILKEMGIYGK